MNDLIRRREFFRLPMEGRREIMRRQAEELRQHYEDTADERLRLQGGDFYEYPSPDDDA